MYENEEIIEKEIELNKIQKKIQKAKSKIALVKQIEKLEKEVAKLHKSIQTLNPTSRLNVIFMKNYNRFLVLDDDMYNSLFIQLYVLENYDKELFEPVILTPLVKVYKLKK